MRPARSAGKGEADSAAAGGSKGDAAGAADGAALLAAASGSAAAAGALAEKAGERAARREAKKRVLLSGLITAIGIALHNFPEASLRSSQACMCTLACAGRTFAQRPA